MLLEKIYVNLFGHEHNEQSDNNKVQKIFPHKLFATPGITLTGPYGAIPKGHCAGCRSLVRNLIGKHQSANALTFTVLPFTLPADNLRTASRAMSRATAT